MMGPKLGTFANSKGLNKTGGKNAREKQKEKKRK
jgi:hypothetical protein